MFQKSSQNPLSVELMDISKQNEAILKFFISGIGKKVFSIAKNSADVEAYIIDYDFPGVQARWDSDHADSKVPHIILSTENPNKDRSVWVAKPLSSKNLITAAASIRELLNEQPLADRKTTDAEDEDIGDEVMPVKPKAISSHIDNKTSTAPKLGAFKNKKLLAPLVTSDTHQTSNKTPEKSEEKVATVQSPKPEAPKPKTQEEIKREAEQREKRWQELCGTSSDSATSAEIPRYVPDNHFIGKLIGGVRLAKQSQQIVEVQSKPYSVYILPNEHLIFTQLSIDTEDFIAFSRAEVKLSDINLHILSSIETGKLELIMSEQPEHIHSLESFVWTNSLLVSQGRLPITLDIEKKTALKYWPSFARIEAFPYSMRIAALWHHSPDTLFKMSEKLGIPQRYVFAFYNGADALDLIERDPKRVKQKMKTKPKKQGGGLISRLFKRLLKGGGAS